MKILSVDYNILVNALKKASSKIKEKHPYIEEILLFGSFSRGNYTPESDIDILMIAKQINIPFLCRKDIFLDFFKDIPFDLNILVYTEGEIKKMFESGNLFVQNIMSESREL